MSFHPFSGPLCLHESFFCKDIFEFPLFEDCLDVDEPVPLSSLHFMGFSKEWTADFTVVDHLFSTNENDNNSAHGPPSLVTHDFCDLSFSCSDDSHAKDFDKDLISSSSQ